MRLSDRTIQTLPVPGRGQKLYADDSLTGFAVRVSQGGSKTFVLTLGEARQRITIGRYPIVSLAQAREKARTILAERQLGIAPKPSPTFGTVRLEYLAQRDDRVRPATRQADGYLFKPFEVLSPKKVADIKAAAIEAILNDIEAPTTQRHAFIRMQGLFRYAVRRDYLDRSPMERLECPADREPRERVLTDAELRAVISTVRAYGHSYGTIVELCAILGQRRQQIGALHVEHVNFDAGTITWPPELMKTGRRHTIPFGPTTRAILSDITPSQDGFFFPSRVNTPFVGWSYHKARFDARCTVPAFRLHDLRRTLATRWQQMGIPIATTEKYLSHSAITGGLVGIYQRSTYLEEMRDAVQRWESYTNPPVQHGEHKAKYPQNICRGDEQCTQRSICLKRM
jgi:integrase